MSNHPISQPYLSRENTEQDLFNTLVLFEDTVPWSIMDVENTQDSEMELSQDWSGFDAVLSQGAQAFFSSLDAVWQASPATSEVSSSPLLKSLVQRLGTQIPQTILSEIAHKTQQGLAKSKAEIDAAILCVQDLLPQWSLEDLLVFNRPFSYAMRSGQTGVERVLQTLEVHAWDELSDFDQARVCLAIAHYALDLAKTVEN